ncbi:MAG: hypothetical protein ISS95_01205 [Candidatus Aenigmarchaeota archaeon]|nr:hypothetical protein [Candidatus Aenigmarchaeota archaeon]
MKLESHIKKLKEHLDGLEWGIREDNHSSVGFHASQGAVELLSILLHKLNLIQMGMQLKHNWFKSERITQEKLDFVFPEKNKILFLMKEIEEYREPLCYGSPKSEEIIQIISDKFEHLKRLIEEKTGENFDV